MGQTETARSLFPFSFSWTSLAGSPPFQDTSESVRSYVNGNTEAMPHVHSVVLIAMYILLTWHNSVGRVDSGSGKRTRETMCHGVHKQGCAHLQHFIHHRVPREEEANLFLYPMSYP